MNLSQRITSKLTQQLVGGGEDGGGVEVGGGRGLLAAQGLGHDGVLLDPGGDRDRGDADAQLVEGEPVGGHLQINNKREEL